MQKTKWCFHVKDNDRPESSELLAVCTAEVGKILTLPNLCDFSGVFNENDVNWFHNRYTVTSGTVPPWLEKPLPRQWVFYVRNPFGDRTLHAIATESEVGVWFRDSMPAQVVTWEKEHARAFLSQWKPVGSPDLPDWLKTEDAK